MKKPEALGGVLKASAFTFILSTLVGSSLSPSLAPGLVRLLRELFTPFSGLGPFELAALIFANNAAKMLIMILGGILLGILPAIFLVSNGVTLGLLTREAAERFGWLYVLGALLPHGAIEIPAFIFSAGMGFLLGRHALRGLRGLESDLKGKFEETLGIYAKIILPALSVAALLEVFVSPQFASLFK